MCRFLTSVLNTLPNGAGVFSTETYTIEDERNYSELIDVVKHVINLV